jgi:eukaryotic-like serine/threonine-protein kinase
MTPAEQLKGLQLENGWTVVDFATRKPNATGGHFSHGYIATNADGRRGFLKAMDYTKAFQHRNTAEVLLAMTRAYVFEKNLCEKCTHLSRVVRAIDGGSIENSGNPQNKVEYLIFELAEGDIRAHLDAQTILDVVFAMKTLHHVATGLQQLHGANIAHQDLKPSNVLVYSAVGSKICDLGRAWDRDMPSDCDTLAVAGDRTYAPPEMLYGEPPGDVRARRYGCDMYHLGSLTVFLFTRVHTNALIIDNLHPTHRPALWGGSYADVLPYVQAAFDAALVTFRSHVPIFLQQDLHQIVTELCEPDIRRRGHPKNRWSNQFGLERYISRFNRLAYAARLQLVSKGKAHAGNP